MDVADWDYPAGLQRPWVRGAMISTVDGAAWAASGTTGALGGAADKRLFALLRSLADVIVVGAGTARAEGYHPVRLHEVDGELRRRLALAPVPRIAVATRSGDVPASLAGQTVLHGPIDWPTVLAGFAAEGMYRVVCEGGPHLLGGLIEQGLVDELCLTIAPTLAAGPANRIALSTVAVEQPLRLAHLEQDGDVLLTRWLLSDGPPRDVL